jgi:DNA-binding NarL/FixJ family response regulator
VSKGNKYLCAEAENLLKKTQENELMITRRENSVLKLLAEGFTNLEIAEKLFISPLTVDSHRKNLIVKLQARNTASLIKIASDKGLV